MARKERSTGARTIRLPHRLFVGALNLDHIRNARGQPLRFRRAALKVVQQVAEQRVIGLLRSARDLAEKSGRMTVTYDDFLAAIRLSE